MRLHVSIETWLTRRPFRLARTTLTDTSVLLVTLEHDGRQGRGECAPYEYKSERLQEQQQLVESLRHRIEAGISARDLEDFLPPCSARAALDCALWDLQARTSGVRAWQRAGLPRYGSLTTAFTLSLDCPAAMAEEALQHKDRPLLKLKLGPTDVVESVRAVRRSAPRSRLIVDANGSWSAPLLHDLMPALADLNVELIEQPLSSGDDEILRGYCSQIPLCADESCQTSADVAQIAGKYDAVNIKLEKAGGLTEALRVARTASEAGLVLMVGNEGGTSLATAPMTIVGQLCSYCDLDGPLCLIADREPSLIGPQSMILAAPPQLWG